MEILFTFLEEKIYVCTGASYDFGVGGNLARHSCLCFERTKRSGAMEVTTSLKRYFKEWALKKLRAGKIKQLFLFDFDQRFNKALEQLNIR